MGGRFTHSDAAREESSVQPFVVSESYDEGGRITHRTFSDGSREQETKSLFSTTVERTSADGSRTRSIRTKRYITDHEGDVEEILFTQTEETWSHDGAVYTLDSMSDNYDGTRSSHSIESGPKVRMESWDHGFGNPTSVTIAIKDDMVEATVETGGARTTSTVPLAELGSDPLGTMSKRVRSGR